MLKIVWDEPKRPTNLKQHRIDLADPPFCDWESAVIVPSYRGGRGEERFLAVLPLSDRLVSAAFSRLGSEAISVISLRPASRKERTLYAEAHSKLD